MFNKFLPKSLFGNIETKFYSNYRKKVPQTHYEVLELSNNCSTKDIKDAYIKLSKKYHPDKNATKGSQKQFVRVLEAYNILSKPDRRLLYDRHLMHGGVCDEQFWQGSSRYNPGDYSSGYGYDDPTFYKNRRWYQGRYQHVWYYGIPGIQKLSNGVIALLCIIFTSIGVTLQFLAIRHSMTLKRDTIQQKSDENKELLARIEEVAEENGNEFQIEALERRFRNNRFYQPSVPKD